MKKLYLTALIALGGWLSAYAQPCSANFQEAFDPICTGQPQVFFNTSDPPNDPTYTYSWNFGAGATPATFVGPNPPTVVYSTPGNKTATLTLSKPSIGCFDIQTKNFDVVTQPSISFTSNAPQCEGTAVNFTYTGSATISYLWDFGVGATPQSSTVQNPQGIIYSSSGTKTITLTINNGVCQQTTTQTITILATPTAGFSSTAPGCTGMTVDFINTGTVTGTTWLWNFGAGATPATSTVQDPVGVVYSTSGSKVVTLTTTNTATGCTAFATQTININQTPAPAFTSTAPQCQGSAIGFTYTGTTGTGWTYVWDFGTGSAPALSSAQNPGSVMYSTAGTKTITLIVTNNGFCTQTITSTITINALPVASAGMDTTICANTSVQIGSASQAGFTYSWFPASTLSSSTISNPVASPIAPVTTYIVTMSNNTTGCIGQDSVVVTMLAPLAANAGVDGEICRYDSIQIGAALVEGQVYSWAPSAGLSSTTSPNPVSSPAATTTYTLTVTGNGCASVMDEVTVIVHPLPIANAGLDDTITVGQSTQLIATGGVQYTWSPFYGLSNTGVFNPIANPDTTTTYIVTLIDIYGCVNSDTMTVKVIAPSFWIATGFTPDNNGHNDVLFVRGEGINNFEFAVFDRWGEQLFYTKDLNTGWDGTKQGTGKNMPEGAYVYFVKGELSNGDPVTSKGLVNLIR